MEKYYFKNWKTFPIKNKSFDGQMDRFVKVCVVSINNPDKVLDIIPIFGKESLSGLRDIIRLIYDKERGIELDQKSNNLLQYLQKPIIGQFEEIKSMHGPLFHKFTPDEAEYGLCSKYDVWKPERDNQGKVIEYMSMKVFTLMHYDSDLGKYNFAAGWFPSQMYYKYYGYRYLPISQLKEPVQI